MGHLAWKGVRLFPLFLLMCAAFPLRAQDRLTAGAGVTNVLDSFHHGIAYLEYHADAQAWGLKPIAGFLTAEGGDYYAYVGLRKEFTLSLRWRFIPSFSAGYYEPGKHHPELGGPVEFHTTLRLEVAWDGNTRLGLAYGHISNANLYTRNPGTNSISLYLSLPLGTRR